MAIVLRKVKGILIVYDKDELLPMIGDTYVSVDVVDAILNEYYRAGTVVNKNSVYAELKQIGLQENEEWKVKSKEDREKITQDKIDRYKKIQEEKLLRFLEAENSPDYHETPFN